MKRKLLLAILFFGIIFSSVNSYSQVNKIQKELGKLLGNKQYNCCDSIFDFKKVDLNKDRIDDYVLLTVGKSKGLGGLYVLISVDKYNYMVYHYYDDLYEWGSSINSLIPNNEIYVIRNYFYLKRGERGQGGSKPISFVFYEFFHFSKGKLFKFKAKVLRKQGKYSSNQNDVLWNTRTYWEYYNLTKKTRLFDVIGTIKL